MNVDLRSLTLAEKNPISGEPPEVKSMEPFRPSLHRRLARVTDFLRKLPPLLRPQAQEIRLQRMCPLCGLITPRAHGFVWSAANHSRAFTPNKGLHTRNNSQVSILQETTMLWTIVAVLVILWFLGFSLHVAGGLIHLLLIVAVVMVIVNLSGGRRGTA
jgi:uncharacterized membrane protein